MEVGILKEALYLARSKLTLRSNSEVPDDSPMKVVTGTLGVADAAARVEGEWTRRGPRDGDAELFSDTRRAVDACPYRRITPLLNRERLYRLMNKHDLKHDLLPARDTGRRRQHQQIGKVATLRYPRCYDGFEFTCWSGETVHVAFVLDCHDRQAIGWTTAGIPGVMISDRMTACVDGRFHAPRAPMCPTADRQWAIYAAAKPMTSLRRDLASHPSKASIMFLSAQSPTRRQHLPPVRNGWSITKKFAHIAGSATVHPRANVEPAACPV